MAFQTQPVIRILTRNSRVHSCQVRHRRIEWRQRTVNSASSEMRNAKRMEFNLLISKLIVDKVLILSYQLDPGLRDRVTMLHVYVSDDGRYGRHLTQLPLFLKKVSLFENKKVSLFCIMKNSMLFLSTTKLNNSVEDYSSSTVGHAPPGVS